MQVVYYIDRGKIYTVEVAASNPAAPTIKIQILKPLQKISDSVPSSIFPLFTIQLENKWRNRGMSCIPPFRKSASEEY